ncbi:AAA family ATPase [Succinivibrio faecicola]|uniref:AAA family ATPase n=2 Tax=Succinivibrio TaxID=83770 RepID=A0ABS7DE18_9GAMM|nr:AAA family ATPase [Succinivibrio faecicola]MBW7569547.1 AAA family ATPase [Succinivibrio faecicola]
MKSISNSGSFTDFYNNNRIYIDKTETIYNLLMTQDKVFISRPRRFGKSLTLDTIATLFQYGVDPYFKNTWIYDKWTEDTYPVLKLSFLTLGVDSIELFNRKLVSQISIFAKDNNVDRYVESDDPSSCLFNLLTELNKQERQIVILIDEYDCQLTANINNPMLYEEFKAALRNIYGCLKDQSSIKFFAATGVTRLKDTTIFSVGSDIKDISNYTEYSQLIGFTRDEIKTFYKDYLKLSVSYENKIPTEDVTESQIDKMLDKLAYYYDGYCFDKRGQKKVFSTWSVNNFFQEVKNTKEVLFGDYWYDNGGIPSILANYLKSHKLNAVDYFDKNKVVTVPVEVYANPTSLLDIDQNVLMCQTGYLTLRSSLTVGAFGVNLGIPNYEVQKALSSLLATKIFESNTIMTLSMDANDLFNNGSTDSIIERLNCILNCITYDNYPITSESALVNYINLFLTAVGIQTTIECHTSKGRADLTLELASRRIVFEFKYAQNQADAVTKLEEAVNQIKTHDYGNIIPIKELIRIAAVFNADPAIRRFSEYMQI